MLEGGFTWLNRSDSVMQKLNIYGEPYILGKTMAPNFDIYPLPSPLLSVYMCSNRQRVPGNIIFGSVMTKIANQLMVLLITLIIRYHIVTLLLLLFDS